MLESADDARPFSFKSLLLEYKLTISSLLLRDTRVLMFVNVTALMPAVRRT